MFVDLHIHSCLSPCADNDMTPANICGMARLKGLDAIAVTDHNTARNLPYVQEAADAFGLLLLPGLEITTREEVHLLGYFPTVAAAMEAGDFFTRHLPPMHNRPDYFGRQLVVDTEDRTLAQEDALLIGATDQPLEACVARIHALGGIAVPAHINRGANGLLMNLGMMPPSPPFPLVETAPELPLPAAVAAGRTLLHSSDAHQLGRIQEAVFALPIPTHTFPALWQWLLAFYG